jgi:hypothetical protein
LALAQAVVSEAGEGNHNKDALAVEAVDMTLDEDRETLGRKDRSEA